MRLQDTHTILLGDIATDQRDFRWVCIGTTNLGGDDLAYVFAREVSGMHGTGRIKERMWTKTFSFSKAFVEQIKDAASFEKATNAHPPKQ